MRIVVMGAGAVGSAIGGFLAKAGNKVSLIGREKYMAAIAARGLKITGLWGEHLVTSLSTFTSPQQVPREALDFVLITTKAHDTLEATKQVSPLLSEDTLVISLQNGLGNVEAIASVVGGRRTVGGRIVTGFELVREGEVKVSVHADKVLLGSPSGEVAEERLSRIALCFDQAGIPCEVTQNIMGFIWGKALYNCCLNALSALFEAPYGELMQCVDSYEIMTALIEEIFAVARRKGVELLWDSPREYRALLFGRLIPLTSTHHSSMFQDVKLGRRTEIDHLNGAIVRLGEEVGVSAPMNWLITRLIKIKEYQQRRPSRG